MVRILNQQLLEPVKVEEVLVVNHQLTFLDTHHKETRQHCGGSEG